MALPAPLIPNFSGLLNNYAVGYEQADAMRKRNLLLEAGALAAGGAPTVSPSLTQGSSPAAYQTSSLSSRIRGAESGGRLDAKNPNSSAYGPDQFIASTWLDMIRRHRPDVAAGKSPAELLALRSNSELSAQMTDAYAAENSRALQSAGLPVTDGTQYLSHFAGPAGARSVLSADPSTPVSRLLQPAAVRANPFLANMTAGDLRNWADRKVGGRTAQAAPAAPGGGLAAASNVLLRGGEINSGLALQDRMRKEQQETEAKASEKQKEMWGIIGDLALTADTPEKWTRAISVAKNYGLNVDGLDDFAARDLVLARSGRMKTAMEAAKPDYMAVGKRVFNKTDGQFIGDPNAPADAGAEFAKQPIYGTDAQGNTVILQLNDAGQASQTKLPEGVTVGKDPIRLDAGTHFVLLDPVNRQEIGRIPKNVAAEAQLKAEGEATGKAKAALPTVETNAASVLKYLDDVLVDPYLPKMTGPIDARKPNLSGDASRVQSKINQLNGAAFLQAFEAIRGGGAITEVEGQKATQAKSRMDSLSVNDADYPKAVQDFKDEVVALVNLARRKAGVTAGSDAPKAAPQSLEARKQKWGLE